VGAFLTFTLEVLFAGRQWGSTDVVDVGNASEEHNRSDFITNDIFR